MDKRPHMSQSRKPLHSKLRSQRIANQSDVKLCLMQNYFGLKCVTGLPRIIHRRTSFSARKKRSNTLVNTTKRFLSCSNYYSIFFNSSPLSGLRLTALNSGFVLFSMIKPFARSISTRIELVLNLKICPPDLRSSAT
ncbi:hypothetical protein DYBT9623_00111 [Dyadobacter sp. CECT 9623]|uniref:Uncharacterized protein n=1 Tax=Dyadobacter linearis TaxID=2823330 RepID=A0ABM8UIV8_9BACT|nr:hypothetical protein DYBT9623_00111 [Dyadobacter sp. CECT 9623]